MTLMVSDADAWREACVDFDAARIESLVESGVNVNAWFRAPPYEPGIDDWTCVLCCAAGSNATSVILETIS